MTGPIGRHSRVGGRHCRRLTEPDLARAQARARTTLPVRTCPGHHAGKSHAAKSHVASNRRAVWAAAVTAGWAFVRHRPRVALAGTTVVMLVLSSLGWGTAYSAWRATTASATNSWTTGTVSFGANSPATTMFSVTGAKPGSFDTRCVKVTYQGSLTGRVRLYVAPGGVTGTGLANHLTLQINQGTGNNGDCSDFVTTGNVYNATGLTDTTKTIATFASASSTFATGVSGWDNVATNATRTFQFKWRLQNDNADVSKTAGVTFTWEAQS